MTEPRWRPGWRRYDLRAGWVHLGYAADDSTRRTPGHLAGCVCAQCSERRKAESDPPTEEADHD